MSTLNKLLPPGFDALEPFAETWAIAGAANRAKSRSGSNEADRNTFYQAAKDLLAPALEYLDQKLLKTLDEQEQRLMKLVLCFAHIAQAVEVQEDNEATHARLREALTITRASADFIGLK